MFWCACNFLFLHGLRYVTCQKKKKKSQVLNFAFQSPKVKFCRWFPWDSLFITQYCAGTIVPTFEIIYSLVGWGWLEREQGKAADHCRTMRWVPRKEAWPRWVVESASGRGDGRDTGKGFWEVITLHLNSEHEQELVWEEKQVLGKKKKNNISWILVKISVTCNWNE